MAALADTHPTMLDLAKASDPNGSIADIVEIMNETNPILDDVVTVEGNLITGHMTTIRAGLPTPTWRKMYQGVQPTKGRTVQITDNCGTMEAYAEVDKKLANINGNAPKWRLSEDRAHIEGMSQEMVNTLFFGSEGVQPEAFTGLAARYNARSGAGNSENVIHGGGSGNDNTSIWLVVFSTDTIHGIVPKGSKAGIQHQDLGEVTIENVDGLGGRMQAYRSHYTWDFGLTVRDWRYAVRIPNIDKSALIKTAASGADLSDLMFQAMRRIPSMSKGRAAFYMSRDTLTMLSQQLSYLTRSSTLVAENVGGKLVERFQGIPVRQVDALAVDETLVPA